MSFLDNKYIPLLDSITYTIDLKPKKVDPNGRIRTPEEIKNGTKQFVHTVYIDKAGNVYIIPLKYENGSWVECYSHEDIVKAAVNDLNSKALIEKTREEFKEMFKKDILSDTFLQRLYEQEKDYILRDINDHRAEDDEPLLTITMPPAPKTHTTFTNYDFSNIILTLQNK